MGQVEPVRRRLQEATGALLGDTIALTDEQWAEPSRLPGWSRARLAGHVVRNADSLRAVVDDAVAGRPRFAYPSSWRRSGADERRPGVELQIDLDTSASRLATSLDTIDDWERQITLPVGRYPLSAVPLARLHEVVLHHLDLKTGFAAADLDPVMATWLLQWAAWWRSSLPNQPCVRLESSAGTIEEIGHGDERVEVMGTDAELWAWITGRDTGNALDGASGIYWNLLG